MPVTEKLMVSPLAAVWMASRSEPVPLSLRLMTMMLVALAGVESWELRVENAKSVKGQFRKGFEVFIAVAWALLVNA